MYNHEEWSPRRVLLMMGQQAVTALWIDKDVAAQGENEEQAVRNLLSLITYKERQREDPFKDKSAAPENYHRSFKCGAPSKTVDVDGYLFHLAPLVDISIL